MQGVPLDCGDSKMRIICLTAPRARVCPIWMPAFRLLIMRRLSLSLYVLLSNLLRYVSRPGLMKKRPLGPLADTGARGFRVDVRGP